MEEESKNTYVVDVLVASQEPAPPLEEVTKEATKSELERLDKFQAAFEANLNTVILDYCEPKVSCYWSFKTRFEYELALKYLKSIHFEVEVRRTDSEKNLAITDEEIMRSRVRDCKGSDMSFYAIPNLDKALPGKENEMARKYFECVLKKHQELLSGLVEEFNKLVAETPSLLIQQMFEFAPTDIALLVHYPKIMDAFNERIKEYKYQMWKPGKGAKRVQVSRAAADDPEFVEKTFQAFISNKRVRREMEETSSKLAKMQIQDSEKVEKAENVNNEDFGVVSIGESSDEECAAAADKIKTCCVCLEHNVDCSDDVEQSCERCMNKVVFECEKCNTGQCKAHAVSCFICKGLYCKKHPHFMCSECGSCTGKHRDRCTRLDKDAPRTSMWHKRNEFSEALELKHVFEEPKVPESKKVRGELQVSPPTQKDETLNEVLNKYNEILTKSHHQSDVVQALKKDGKPCEQEEKALTLLQNEMSELEKDPILNQGAANNCFKCYTPYIQKCSECQSNLCCNHSVVCDDCDSRSCMECYTKRHEPCRTCGKCVKSHTGNCTIGTRVDQKCNYCTTIFKCTDCSLGCNIGIERCLYWNMYVCRNHVKRHIEHAACQSCIKKYGYEPTPPQSIEQFQVPSGVPILQNQYPSPAHQPPQTPSGKSLFGMPCEPLEERAFNFAKKHDIRMFERAFKENKLFMVVYLAKQPIECEYADNYAHFSHLSFGRRSLSDPITLEMLTLFNVFPGYRNTGSHLLDRDAVQNAIDIPLGELPSYNFDNNKLVLSMDALEKYAGKCNTLDVFRQACGKGSYMIIYLDEYPARCVYPTTFRGMIDSCKNRSASNTARVWLQ